MSTSRRVLVTVGMGRWPFDRLISALDPVCARHEVFAQIGTTTVTPPCAHERFVSPAEFDRRMAEADVVVTHAGNTVRLVHRRGRVPIALARDPRRGEMGNDHQLRSLAVEDRRGSVVRADLDRLATQVDEHPEAERRLLARCELSRPSPARSVRERLARLRPQPGNPFRDHPVRRYEFAFDQLAGLEGRHLDLGCERGEFLAALADHSGLAVEGAEPMAEYRAELTGRRPDLRVHRLDPGTPLPFPAGHFDSVSLLDVLEHTPDERRTLAEIHRVLRPGGLLVVTVPAHHALSALDPDNAKFRVPRLHRLVYSSRFGRASYHRRFLDLTDGLRGDLDAGRAEHTNYRPADLIALLADVGFEVVVRDGANLLWRLIDIPRLLLPTRMRRLLDRPLRADGRLFHRANLFLVAEKRPIR